MNTLTQLQEPDAKLLYLGKSALTDNDILSLLLAGTDNKLKATILLKATENNFDNLSKMCYNDLKKYGLSHLQAVRTIAVIEFAKRMNIHRSIETMPPQVRSSTDLFNVMSPYLSGLAHEEFWAVLLNRANRVIKKVKMSQGGVSGTTTDIRIIMRECVNELASGLVVCHNHPSGNMSPSDSDIRITAKIKEAAQLMDVQLLDHLIFGNGTEYYSMADNGAL